MDPIEAITAVATAINTGLAYQRDMFNALPPEEKTKQAMQAAADQQKWRDFWQPLVNLIQPRKSS